MDDERSPLWFLRCVVRGSVGSHVSSDMFDSRLGELGQTWHVGCIPKLAYRKGYLTLAQTDGVISYRSRTIQSITLFEPHRMPILGRTLWSCNSFTVTEYPTRLKAKKKKKMPMMSKDPRRRFWLHESCLR